MKQKISITIEEDTIKIIKKLLTQTQFRNRSHIIEYSLMKFIKEEKSN